MALHFGEATSFKIVWCRLPNDKCVM